MKVIVEPLAANGNTREVLEPKSNEEILAIVQRSINDGRRVTFQPPTLEDAFIKLVGGSIEE